MDVERMAPPGLRSGRDAPSVCALREPVSQGVDTQRAAPVPRRLPDPGGLRALGFGATGRVSTDRVMGELPWRGRCFEATACRLPVRP